MGDRLRSRRSKDVGERTRQGPASCRLIARTNLGQDDLSALTEMARSRAVGGASSVQVSQPQWSHAIFTA
jgi:hypothetical protein